MNIEKISKKDEINRILENMPAELELAVDLPSRGRFYKLKDDTMPITVRAMKFEDEKLVADSSRKKADPVNTLLHRCVKNVDIDELFVFDKLAILLKIREATYGPEYEFDQVCNACSMKSQVKFNLNDLILTEVPNDFTGKEEILLPVLQKKAIIRHPRVKEEHYLKDLNVKNLWRFVVSIDGCEQSDIIGEVLRKMPLRDVHALIKEIGGEKYGLDPKMNFRCPECEEEEVIGLPIGTDFFYMS